MKNKKFNKKKIAVSVTSITLVLATLIALVPNALASTDRSLEYIEYLKQKNSFKILEIAPTESDGVIGYYVKDFEPIANWKEQVAALTNPLERETYVNNEVNTKLLGEGVMSREANKAPLYLEDMYDESYPWEINSIDGYNVLNLNKSDSVRVRGTMEDVGAQNGDYIANNIYVPVDNYYKNFFNFSLWKLSLGDKPINAETDVEKFANTKILAVDEENKEITVFGSTSKNWGPYDRANGASLYSIESAYSRPDYYSIEMEENGGKFHGGAFVLSFDAKVDNGKGQITIIPYDKNGKIVKYSPNISKQYWYRQGLVGTGHYEYNFTVPENSEIKYVQIRFDVDNLKATAAFSNISVYKYRKNEFENNSGVLSVDKSKGSSEKQTIYFDCNPQEAFILNYHTELMPGGAKTKVSIIGYDENDNIVKDSVGNDSLGVWENSISGTYSVSFPTKNAVKIAVVFDVVKKSGASNKAHYSNISIVKALDFMKNDATATHRQVIDHFENGNVTAQFSGNIFNFHEWSGSDSSKISLIDSDVSSTISTDETNGIITISNKGATSTSSGQNDKSFYYIPVEDNSTYRLKYVANSSSTDPHYVKVVFYNENKTSVIGEKVFEKKPVVAGPDEYTIDIDTDCRWIQISFGNTKNNQVNVFSSISLCKRVNPKVYYYSVRFTEVPLHEIATLEDKTALYTPQYKAVKAAGELAAVEGQTYYYYDEYNDKYEEVTDLATLPSDTMCYVLSGLYDYVGHVGDEGITFNILRDYYTAEINYDGYALVTDPTIIGAGTTYFIKDGNNEFVAQGIKSDSSEFDEGTEYYILASPVKESCDERHPYWVPEGEFVEVEDDMKTALFTRKSDGYRYVGENEGNYKIKYDPNGKEEMVINTSIVYYKGGIINNEWFKKGVLNCNEEEINTVAVSVTTVTPEYLNKLDEEVLTDFLQGYELFVLSYGGVNGKVQYKEDINENVRAAIIKEAIDGWDTFDSNNEKVENSQYKIPVVIDNRIRKMSGTKLADLSEKLLDDCDEGFDENSSGVNKYIYLFDASDVKFNVVSMVNNLFLEGMRVPYTSANSPYYPVYKELTYENFIRKANQDKYSQLDTTVSEAAAIRYILNYRGQRLQNYKEKIRILEIQPYTEESELLKLDGTLKDGNNVDTNDKNNVKKWFLPSEDFQYFNENHDGNAIDIEVTTMAMGELAAKNESIVENYDVVYIGASIKNFTKVGTIVNNKPDYNDNNLDGNYYISTGDVVETGIPGLNSSPLAGLVGTDYHAVRDFSIGDRNIGGLASGTIGDLWWTDASTCALRKSGNDMTPSIRDQLEAFAASGRPVIFADDLVENEFVGEFSVDIKYERVGWDTKTGYPIFRLIADLNTEGTSLPEGVQPAFTWFCKTNELKSADKSFSGGTIKAEDVDGDKINEGVYEFIYKPGDSLRGLGEYYAQVSFKFTKVKYKGLKDITNLRSDSVKLEQEQLTYVLEFITEDKTNLKHVEAELTLKNPADKSYMPSLYENGGKNLIYRFNWRGLDNFGADFDSDEVSNVTITPDPFDPSYDPYTNRSIKTSVDFSKSRYGYSLRVYIDAPNSDKPTLEIYKGFNVENYGSSKRRDESGVLYYDLTIMEGTGTRKKSASGIAINEDTFDNSSYTYECVKEIFKNTQNVFSEMMLNMNTNLETNSLLRAANLSAPQIVLIDHYEPVCYPDMLNERTLSFKFKIINPTDDTVATSRYRYEFYVDNNSDGKFSKKELTDAKVYGSGMTSMGEPLRASTNEVQNIYSFNKKFPETTSGVVPWKLVITKIGTDKDENMNKIIEEATHDSITKYSYIKPEEKASVKAVQILPADWESDYVSLNRSGADGDHYRGSVFLCDAFVNPALTGSGVKGKGTHFPLKRVIYYDVYNATLNKDGTKTLTKVSSGISEENAKYSEIRSSILNSQEIKPTKIDFTVGDDWTLEISFTNVHELNAVKDDETNKLSSDEVLYNVLNKYDMLILGFGDSYGRHEQVKDSHTDDNEGFQQAPVRVIERLIDDGKPALFCHDTAFYSNDFVGYLATDFGNTFAEWTQAAENLVKRAWNAIKEFFGSDNITEIPENSVLHSDRVAQGYYLNIGLRDKLGLDRYGVTKGIKDRIIARNDDYNVYSDIKYHNENLRNAHDYSTIYYDGRKINVKATHNVTDTFKSEMLKTKDKTITVQQRADEYLDGFYDVAYIPGSNRQQVDVFFQGYTDFVIEKFRYGDSYRQLPNQMTDKVTQVNSGQITSYPYDINVDGFRDDNTFTNDRRNYGTLDVSPTHEQIYQVSLQADDEGNGTTVWYALAQTETKYTGRVEREKDRDKKETISANYNSFRNNATNGYFIYTHNNVTYTGSGHTNEFTVDEAKLFINTIVAAYRINADKPTVEFVTPDSQAAISYQTMTSSADESGNISVEDDEIYFVVKETGVESSTQKNLGVEFYLTAEPVKDAAGAIIPYEGTVWDYSDSVYHYKDKIGSMDNLTNNETTLVRPRDLSLGIMLTDENGQTTNQSMSVSELLADSETNELTIYAVPTSIEKGFRADKPIVKGDGVPLTLRELNLRTLE